MLEVVFASPQFVGAELSGFIEVIVRITGGSSIIIMDDPVVIKKIIKNQSSKAQLMCN